MYNLLSSLSFLSCFLGLSVLLYTCKLVFHCEGFVLLLKLELAILTFMLDLYVLDNVLLHIVYYEKLSFYQLRWQIQRIKVVNVFIIQ